MGSAHMKSEDVILFYRKRGHAENFIWEVKNGFDLHHFPCQNLDANRVYGIIAAFAYNFMRFLSLITSPGKVEFAEKFRFRLVSLAAQVVRQARQTLIVFPKRLEEKISRCFMNKEAMLGCGLVSCDKTPGSLITKYHNPAALRVVLGPVLTPWDSHILKSDSGVKGVKSR